MAELTVFLQNGATYHFIDVENLNIDKDEETLEFDYYGQTVMKKRHAQFDTYKITGYAVDSQMVENDSIDENEEVKVPLKYQEHIDLSEALDDVINNDSKDEKKTKELNNRLSTALVQDYMETHDGELNEEELAEHLFNAIIQKAWRDSFLPKGNDKEQD